MMRLGDYQRKMAEPEAYSDERYLYHVRLLQQNGVSSSAQRFGREFRTASFGGPIGQGEENDTENEQQQAPTSPLHHFLKLQGRRLERNYLDQETPFGLPRANQRIHNATCNVPIQVQNDDGRETTEMAYLLRDSPFVDQAYHRWPNRASIPVYGRGQVVLAQVLVREERHDGRLVFRKTDMTAAIHKVRRSDVNSPSISRLNPQDG